MLSVYIYMYVYIYIRLYVFIYVVVSSFIHKDVYIYMSTVCAHSFLRLERGSAAPGC
jgi:hypothetical protein